MEDSTITENTPLVDKLVIQAAEMTKAINWIKTEIVMTQIKNNIKKGILQTMRKHAKKRLEEEGKE